MSYPRRVHKTVIPTFPGEGRHTFGAATRVLSVGVQGGDVVLWWEHDDQPDEGLRERWNVSLVWTGHSFIPYGDFVGTVTTPDELVWHVYAGRL